MILYTFSMTSSTLLPGRRLARTIGVGLGVLVALELWSVLEYWSENKLRLGLCMMTEKLSMETVLLDYRLAIKKD
jgi:hypothetical protein